MNSYLQKGINEFVGTFLFLLLGLSSIKETSIIHPIFGFGIALSIALTYFSGDYNSLISICKWIFAMNDYNIITLISCLLGQLFGAILAFSIWSIDTV